MKEVKIIDGSVCVDGKKMDVEFPNSREVKKVAVSGEGQPRWRRGSYLTEEQCRTEIFNKKMGITD